MLSYRGGQVMVGQVSVPSCAVIPKIWSKAGIAAPDGCLSQTTMHRYPGRTAVPVAADGLIVNCTTPLSLSDLRWSFLPTRFQEPAPCWTRFTAKIWAFVFVVEMFDTMLMSVSTPFKVICRAARGIDRGIIRAPIRALRRESSRLIRAAFVRALVLVAFFGCTLPDMFKSFLLKRESYNIYKFWTW